MITAHVREMLVGMQVHSQQLKGMSKEVKRDEENQRYKMRKAYQEGRTGMARIYAKNAILLKKESLTFLSLSSKIDAFLSVVQGKNVTMKEVEKAKLIAEDLKHIEKKFLNDLCLALEDRFALSSRVQSGALMKEVNRKKLKKSSKRSGKGGKGQANKENKVDEDAAESVTFNNTPMAQIDTQQVAGKRILDIINLLVEAKSIPAGLFSNADKSLLEEDILSHTPVQVFCAESKEASENSSSKKKTRKRAARKGKKNAK